MRFQAANGCRQSPGGIWELYGNLTIKDVIRSVTLVVSKHRIRKGAFSPVIDYSLFGCINRSDFGLSADEHQLHECIYLTIDIELHQTGKK